MFHARKPSAPRARPLAAGHPAGPGGHVRRPAFIEDPDRSESGALARPCPSAETSRPRARRRRPGCTADGTVVLS